MALTGHFEPPGRDAWRWCVLVIASEVVAGRKAGRYQRYGVAYKLRREDACQGRGQREKRLFMLRRMHTCTRSFVNFCVLALPNTNTERRLRARFV